MTTTRLRSRLAELIQQATDGAVVPADALVEGASLGALGLDSLGLLRLIDAIEAEYDVEIDFGGGRISPDSLDSFVDYLAARGVRTGGSAA
jgi:acyl carrier protein